MGTGVEVHLSTAWTRRMVPPWVHGSCHLWSPLSPSWALQPLPMRPRGFQRTEAAFANHLHLFLPGKRKITELGGISAFPSLSWEKRLVTDSKGLDKLSRRPSGEAREPPGTCAWPAAGEAGQGSAARSLLLSASSLHVPSQES